MRLAVSSYSFRNYLKESGCDHFELCRLAKEMGFEGIEFVALDEGDFCCEDPLAAAAALRDYCKEIGLFIVAYAVGDGTHGLCHCGQQCGRGGFGIAEAGTAHEGIDNVACRDTGNVADSGKTAGENVGHTLHADLQIVAGGSGGYRQNAAVFVAKGEFGFGAAAVNAQKSVHMDTSRKDSRLISVVGNRILQG